jgi:hypothetical protein
VPRYRCSISEIQAAHDAANLETARQIAANPSGHGGAGSGLHVWALRVIERLSPGELERAVESVVARDE